jgi:hypothetical protein
MRIHVSNTYDDYILQDLIKHMCTTNILFMHAVKCVANIPGHFFNTEHSPYLFPMFSFKKHRSMHVCNYVTKVTKIST